MATGHGDENPYTLHLVPKMVTGGGLRDAAVVHVAAGVHHSMALTATGELWTWGTGELWTWGTGYEGQLGHGTMEGSDGG